MAATRANQYRCAIRFFFWRKKDGNGRIMNVFDPIILRLLWLVAAILEARSTGWPKGNYWRRLGEHGKWARHGDQPQNPKAEGRNPKEGRSPKSEYTSARCIRISDFGLLSAFGLRISDFQSGLDFQTFPSRPVESPNR